MICVGIKGKADREIRLFGMLKPAYNGNSDEIPHNRVGHKVMEVAKHRQKHRRHMNCIDQKYLLGKLAANKKYIAIYQFNII